MAEFFATTAKGLESLTEAELKSMGIETAKAVVGGVSFEGEFEQAYRSCLWSRFASRVLFKLSEFALNDVMDLYLASNYIHWEKYFDPAQTFAVHCIGTNTVINNSQFGALKVKDAIVDRFQSKTGQRPNVDRNDPDIRIVLRISRDKAILSLDMAGQPLNQRGYRGTQGAAPLKENLAAAIVARAAWAQGRLIDPMCGSGTLLIEAAMMAADIAPGHYRHEYALEKWKTFDRSAWQGLRDEIASRAATGLEKCQSKLTGYDIDRNMIHKAKENIAAAGLTAFISVHTHDAAQLPDGPKETGLIVCNPPYGERLGETPALTRLFAELGERFKQGYPGWNLAMFSGTPELLDYMRLRSHKTYKLYNGPLACELKLYQVGTHHKENASSDTPQQRYAADFINRINKNIKRLSKWVKQDGIECYRLYDADLPEYNVAVDRYLDYLVVQEYRAPKEIDPNKARKRLFDLVTGLSASGLVESDKVVVKTRQQQKGKQQYQKVNEQKERLVVAEYGAKFYVNLTDYLDTGLFLDHRNMRHWLAQNAKGKRVLNLFAYTGAASVHAAMGGASHVTTVDMSNTYLNWAKDNFRLNHLTITEHDFIRADCLQWLGEPQGKSFDVIFLDPPTFSNSKKMEGNFDVQRDHLQLITQAKALLAPGGTLIFSNNKRQFKLDQDGVAALGLKAKNISSQSLSPDFERNKQIHNCWLIEAER
jgi:23S rRNA (guanine2445-N2)-methyltransferase / 23S rRNA (guanine2069-N7)-methyltransferase